MTPPVRLEARELAVRVGDRSVLEAVSLTASAGAIVGISGASGSGKSTLLRALALLVPLSGGAVLLDGVDAEQLEPTSYRRRVAYVAQHPPMLPGSVKENLGAGLLLRGETLAHERAVALLDDVGLPASFAERPSGELSGGERSRVALARAFALEPEVLLVDEPTAPLDPVAARRVLELLRTRAHAGLAIVLVTHVRAHLELLGCAPLVCEGGRLGPEPVP